MNVNEISLRPAKGTADMEVVTTLFLEYAASLGFSLCFQGLDRELATLPGAYTPPAGQLLLAEQNDEAVGVVGLRPLHDGGAEMKRLFVRPKARGLKIGLRLALGIIEEARKRGYSTLRLETLHSMAKAQTLYESLGFTPCPPYITEHLPEAVYLELNLAASTSSSSAF
ncbi:Acetyltransferase CD1211 [Azospirillaceae bacterium]